MTQQRFEAAAEKRPPGHLGKEKILLRWTKSVDMWVYKGERNHTATREFLPRVIFQKNLSAMSAAVPVGAQSRAGPCVTGEVSDTRLVVPVLLPGK